MSSTNTKKYSLPKDDFVFFGYSCTNTSVCEDLLTNYYKENYGEDEFKKYDFKQRVQCYKNDAPEGNSPGIIADSHKNNFAIKEELNSTFCACRVDFGWEGKLCDSPSSRSKVGGYMFFGLFAFMILLGLYRGRLTINSFRSSVVRSNDARGFTLKAATIAHSIFYPLSSLCYAIYYTMGPGNGKVSEQLRVFQSIIFQTSLAIGLLALLVLTLAFIDIATSMKQLQGFKKARLPLIAFVVIFFIVQVLLLFLGAGSSGIFVTVVMSSILFLLAIIGPGWMFYKFSASLLHEQNSDEERKKDNATTNVYTGKQTFRDGCSNCIRALCKDISDTLFNQLTDSTQDSDSYDNSTNNKNSRDEHVTDLTPALNLGSMGPKDSPEPNPALKFSSSMITVISQSNSDSEKNARDRSESKESKVSIEHSQSINGETTPTKSPLNTPNSKDSKISQFDDKSPDWKRFSKGMNSAVVGVKSSKSKGHTKQRSDRKVARFLSRVLQLSIRLGVFLFLFVATLVTSIPFGSNYFALSLNVQMISLQTMTRFFQLFYGFLITDAILWFFSDVLRKELEKKKRNSVAGSKTVPQNMINENDSKEDVAVTKRFGSKTDISKGSSLVMNGFNEASPSVIQSSKDEQYDIDGNGDKGTGNDSKV